MNFKNLKAYLGFIRFMEFFRWAGIQPLYFLIPVVFSLSAALFEGVSIGLLVPFLKGAIERDFSFAREIPVLKPVIGCFPQVMKSNINLFALLLILIFVFAVLKNIFNYCSALSVSYQNQKFLHNLRCLILKRYLSFGKLFFDRENIGHLVQVLGGYTQTVTSSLDRLNSLFSSIFMLAIYFIMMLFISWEMTVFILCVFPLLNYSIQWLIKKIRETSKSQVYSQNALSKKMQAILSCMTLIKAYNQEGEEERKYAQLSSAAQRVDFSMVKKRELLNPIHEIMLLCAMLVLVSVVTFFLVKIHTGTIAGYLVYFYILKRTLNNTAVFNNIKLVLATISGPIEEILSVFDDRNKHYVLAGSRIFEGLREGIRFHQMNFGFLKEIPVLKGVGFFLPEGKMTAIVGPSGAGKTTIINLILRFYDCPSGSIYMDEVDIREYTLKSLREKMVLVSQETFLFNDTLRNNILFGLSANSISEEDLWAAVKKARLYDFVMTLPERLETPVGDRGVKLSGGEKQRVSIARAILKKAEILILDEATSALDTGTEKLIQKAIDEAVKGRTAIVIAHRLSTIKHADKIVVVEDGRLAEEGGLESLLAKKGRFFKYWEDQKFY